MQEVTWIDFSQIVSETPETNKMKKWIEETASDANTFTKGTAEDKCGSCCKIIF